MHGTKNVRAGNTFFIKDQACAYHILSKLAAYICIFEIIDG
jgi:hypothetical protein